MPKKAQIGKIIAFIGFILAIVLLVFLIKNKWDFPAAVKGILSILGRK